MNNIDILIITPLGLESNAIRAHLSDVETQTFPAFICDIGVFQGKFYTYQIAVCETGSKTIETALATEKLIKKFNPSLLILSGICGGIKDTLIGDIVVATKAYSYQGGKETTEGLLVRPDVLEFDKELINHTRVTARTNSWQERIPYKKGNPKIVFGPIISGDKIIASTQSSSFQQIKKHYNDTIAVEQEAIAFARAISSYRHLRAMNIRAVSDLIDHKSQSDAEGVQERVITHVAAFIFEWLYTLAFGQFSASEEVLTKKPTMNGNFAKEKDVIRGLIVNNRDKAFDKIEVFAVTQNEGKKNELLLLVGNFREMRKKLNLGLIQEKEGQVEISRIIYAVLNLLN